jgi:hypothetical protein
MNEPLKIVTFHTSAETWADDPHPLAGNPTPRPDLILLFAESIRRSNPDARLVLLTDFKTDVPGIFDHIERAPIKQEELMTERFRMQRNWLRRMSRPTNVAFVDTDTLILEDLSQVFEQTFRLGVTVRDVVRFPWEVVGPYNAGVIFARPIGAPSDGAVHDALIELIERMEREYSAWCGGQLAMRDLLGRRQPAEVVSIRGVDVRIFSCTTHNYRPTDIGEDIDDRLILHFCGTAKPLITSYARRIGIAVTDSTRLTAAK